MNSELPEIRVSVTIKKLIEEVWEKWIDSESIKIWSVPFSDWHCRKAENDFCKDGKFLYRMQSNDGEDGFDHTGIFLKIIPLQTVETQSEDGRRSKITFKEFYDNTIVEEIFEPDQVIECSHQEDFCQKILIQFKNHVENKNKRKPALKFS